MPNPRSLHLKSLKLRNFKGIAELDLTFDESLTLLAGVNGVGKTSVMQALLAAITHTWGAVTPGGYPYFQLEKNVVRAGTTDAEISLALGFSHGSDCEVRLRVEGIALKFGPDWRELRNGFKRFARALPLVVYYEQDRIAHSFAQIHELTFSSRLNWETSLKTTITSPNEFKAWFFEREADEGQIVRERQDLDYADPELEVVRTVLNRLEGFTAVRSRRPSDSGERILYLEKDGANIPFDSLSRGEQAFFLLAADLARRLMLASPVVPVAEAPGIICIDEIELHLHPAWQRRILNTLAETFPACQFVVSTHSPQVIGGVEARHVRLLTPAENGVRKVSQPIASKGRDSNYILKGILDTPERDDDVSHLFAEFDRLADEGELEEAERVLGKLDEAVEGQSSGVAIRQAKWNRLRRAAT